MKTVFKDLKKYKSPLLISHSSIKQIFTGHLSLAAKSLQLCPTLCDLRDGSPPGSSVPGILQARILEWAAISFSKLRAAAAAKLLQSCPTLCDPIDGSPPGSSVPGILQTRILEFQL